MKIADTSAQDLRIIKTNNRKKLRLLIALGALTAAVLAYLIFYVAQASVTDLVLSRDSIRVATVKRGNLLREVVAQGRVVAANSPTLFSPEQGYINLQVKAGDTVEKNQVLAVIISPDLNELLARETANLTGMQADLGRQIIESKRGKLELEQSLALAGVNEKAMVREERRSHEAIKRNLISQLEYEKAKDDLSRAQLEFEQAQQNKALANESLDFDVESIKLQLQSQQLLVDALQRRVSELQILSPVAGMVGNIQALDRQAVTANQPLITIVDLTAFEVEAVVSEGFADDMAPLMEAEITLNGRSYNGILTAISPEVVNGGVAARIRFLDEMPGNLRQNQRLTARILLENKIDTLIVDRGSFFDSFRGDVFIVQDDRAMRIPVVLGSSSLKHVEIMEGLSEGDRIIISALTTEGSDEKILLTN